MDRMTSYDEGNDIEWPTFDMTNYITNYTSLYHLNATATHLQVGIASVWYQGNPCNMHLLSLGEDVKKEVDKDRWHRRCIRPTGWWSLCFALQNSSQDPLMYGFQFNTIGVSDGMSMGTKGMMYSLPSREALLHWFSLPWSSLCFRIKSNLSSISCDFFDFIVISI